MSTKHEFVKLDKWAQDLVVDPLSKEPLSLSKKGDALLSPYGAVYPVVNGIYDLRVLQSETTIDAKIWKKGQNEYEQLLNSAIDYDSQNFFAERASVVEVYREIPIVGRCLDVGGHQGRLRAFLSSDQEYISCDPFISVFDSIKKSKKLAEAYPFILAPVNFICCQAEYLPFRSLSFDTVHMRSVIDHFLNPEIALREAFRVLAHNGRLVVGLYVRGGKQGHESILEKSKEIVKNTLSFMGIDRWTDHHVWHPTFNELSELISVCGFRIVKEHWQKGTDNKVCYLQALKKSFNKTTGEV